MIRNLFFALAMVIPTIASADSIVGTVISSVPITQKEYVNKPVQYCKQERAHRSGDIIAGMAIGGLLGKGISGKDNGAIAGAILGGVIAADGPQKYVTRCDTYSKHVLQETVVGYSTIVDTGIGQVNLETDRKYFNGERINIYLGH